jgi:hypothetical protein
MRQLTRLSLLAGLLSLPLGAAAQTPTIGTVVDETGAQVDTNALACELYSVKSDGGRADDWLAHMYNKAGGGIGLQPDDFVGGTYQVLAGNFFRPEAPTNVVAGFVTCPNGRLHVDSGDLSTGFNFMGSAALQTIGNSILGTLTLPGDASPYPVDMGAGSVDFPVVGANASATVGQSINYAFAPHAELNDVDQGNWTWGGAAPDPGSTLPSGGFIVGYNVYRLEDDGSRMPPDRATLGAMENWVGFMTMEFDQTIGDVGPPGAPADLNPDGDFTGMQNPDMAAYTGDEILLYQDGANPAGDGVTFNPLPADPTLEYWYAVQPVVRGSVADFADIALGGGAPADHAEDLDGDGTDDWVDLDLDGTPDFYSPNENGGFPGLGLTHDSLPLLSPAALSDPARLPATAYLALEVEMGRRGVELSLNTALEAGNVLGYDVFRVVGPFREQVNEELIAARGGNGNTYEIVDDRFSGRRGRSAVYEVEVVFNDGTPTETFGPFAAEARARASRRR